jgi:short-subunit dehydrogenase
VADFSRGREIYAPIREALRDRDIGILVNDVGAFYPYPQYFSQVPEDTLWDIVNVNIAAASLMVHIVLPGMVERKKGAIVTVSSGSCCKPTPQLAAFSASKVRFLSPWAGRKVGSSQLLTLALSPQVETGKPLCSWGCFQVPSRS